MRLEVLARLVPACVVVAMIAVVCVPARAQIESREGIALRNEIYQLQQQVQTLRQQMGGGGQGPAQPPTYLGRPAYPPPQQAGGDVVAQLLARVDSLEEQVRQLRGRVDETQNQVQRMQADLGKRIDDLTFQVQTAGRPPPPARRAPATTEATEPSVAAPSAPPPPAAAPRTPEAAMQEGNAALARRDYAAAEASAREVLNKFRTSPRAYDAQFLLAQALAGQRQNPQAAIAYDDAYNRSRKGAHAPDALLGLATSLAAINEKKAACDTLSKLKTEFPQQRADIRDAAAQVASRASCR